MPCSRLGPANESLQNEVDVEEILNFTLFLYWLQSQHNKNQNKAETSLSYRHLTYRSHFDAAWKALCIACIRD